MLCCIFIISLVLCSALQRNIVLFLLLLFYKILNNINFDLKMNHVSK
jgi:uncharacterized membrane protein